MAIERLTHIACRAVSLGAALFSAATLADPSLPLLLETQSVTLTDSSVDAIHGRLKPHGMLVIPSTVVEGQRLSQLSDLAWDDDEKLLYALSDKGVLFHLRPRFTRGELTGLVLHKVAVLKGEKGRTLRPVERDAEGMDIVNGRNGRRGDAELLISFERIPRVWRYRPDGTFLRAHDLPAELNDVESYQGKNKMLEAVCYDRELGLVLAPELPLFGEPAGSTRLFGLGGKSWRYEIEPKHRISAVECLGNRRVLVLERAVSPLFQKSTVTLNIATLPDTPAVVGTATVEGIATLDVADGFQIDNFEGLTRFKGNRYFMVSDDNDLFLQRTLLLFFEISDSATRH